MRNTVDGRIQIELSRRKIDIQYIVDGWLAELSEVEEFGHISLFLYTKWDPEQY